MKGVQKLRIQLRTAQGTKYVGEAPDRVWGGPGLMGLSDSYKKQKQAETHHIRLAVISPTFPAVSHICQILAKCGTTVGTRIPNRFSKPPVGFPTGRDVVIVKFRICLCIPEILEKDRSQNSSRHLVCDQHSRQHRETRHRDQSCQIYK